MAYERQRPRRRSRIAHPLFEKKLIDNMHDGVVFVDSPSTILLWNTGVERLTGVSSAAACGRTLLPNLMDMCNSREQRMANDDCPVAHAIATGVQWLGRVSIMGRQGRHVAVDLHAIPVRSNDGAIHGATVCLHDVSSETSLEEKCQALHAQVAKDPMTQVANRAEFDRMLNNFVAAHQESNLPCSLIMSDLDHFKHDQRHARAPGRRRGDHHVRVASQNRCAARATSWPATAARNLPSCVPIARTPPPPARPRRFARRCPNVKHTCLGNASFTASFGVTELQTGDTPETMLRRADRALLQAKDQGRNQVVQLGDGMMEEKGKEVWWPFHAWRGSALVEATLMTGRADRSRRAKAPRVHCRPGSQDRQDRTKTNCSLDVTDTPGNANRRKTDRPCRFSDHTRSSRSNTCERSNTQGFAAGTYVETRLDVVIRPRRDRDRRRDSHDRKGPAAVGQLEVVPDGPRRRRPRRPSRPKSRSSARRVDRASFGEPTIRYPNRQDKCMNHRTHPNSSPIAPARTRRADRSATMLRRRQAADAPRSPKPLTKSSPISTRRQRSRSIAANGDASTQLRSAIAAIEMDRSTSDSRSCLRDIDIPGASGSPSNRVDVGKCLPIASAHAGASCHPTAPLATVCARAMCDSAANCHPASR